jgi:hypothetical protein
VELRVVNYWGIEGRIMVEEVHDGAATLDGRL